MTASVARDNCERSANRRAITGLASPTMLEHLVDAVDADRSAFDRLPGPLAVAHGEANESFSGAPSSRCAQADLRTRPEGPVRRGDRSSDQRCRRCADGKHHPFPMHMKCRNDAIRHHATARRESARIFGNADRIVPSVSRPGQTPLVTGDSRNERSVNVFESLSCHVKSETTVRTS